MGYSEYELLWLLFLYSFFGWAAETAIASGKRRTFATRGFFWPRVLYLWYLRRRDDGVSGRTAKPPGVPVLRLLCPGHLHRMDNRQAAGTDESPPLVGLFRPALEL